MEQEWLLLIHQLPPKPTSLRVRTWRKLQQLGAIAIKNSVYVLPFCEKTNEDFQWLKQEIEASGGEASVFRAGAVEGATDEEIVINFRQARDEAYAGITAELEGLTGTIREQKRGGHLSAGRLSNYEAELDKLHALLEHSISIDFFDARGKSAAAKAYERCQKTLHSSQPGSIVSAARSSHAGVLDRSKYQGKRWVTRRNLHIDRLASAWLIKQFIDSRPRFHFVTEEEGLHEGIPFDMFGAEFTHHGEDCTFETLIKRFGLGGDPALRQIAEIIHDIDVKDGKFSRLEATGLNAVVTGMAESIRNDRKLLAQCSVIFDGLYALVNKDAATNEGTGDGDKKRSRKVSSRGSRAKRKRR